MENILAFGMPGGSEWIIILLVVLLLFGAKRLPELAKGLGKSIREFKKATSEVEDNIREAMREEEIKKVEAKPQPEVRAEESAQKSETK
jgi:sec-independent protein translocase protein TatA